MGISPPPPGRGTFQERPVTWDPVLYQSNHFPIGAGSGRVRKALWKALRGAVGLGRK